MKIGIKYCGGCNPGFDRVEAAAIIMNRYKDQAEFVIFDDPGAEIILVIMGCTAACAELNGLDTGKLRFINSIADAENFSFY